MSKYTALQLWNEIFEDDEEVTDYSGRKMLKSACNDLNSKYTPTIDHLIPTSKGGRDSLGNIVLCNKITNYEKADKCPHWKANGKRFRVRKKGNKYYPEEY